jgi:hypothetical protein
MNGDPRPGSDTMIRTMASAAAIVVISLAALVSCQSPVGPAVSSHAPAATSPATALPTATPSDTAATEVRPFWVADLEGQLDCDGPMHQMGREVPAEIAPSEPAPTPERALEGILEFGSYAWLPARGFEPPQVEGHWALYRYLTDGGVKVIAVSTDQFPAVPQEIGWEVVAVRACDPSEFDPADGLTDDSTFWLDADGDRVRADRIFSRPGPEHCGWEGVTFLEFEGKEYLRDVKAVLADQTTRPFRRVNALPSEAVDTGLHTAAVRLFTVPDEQVVYVRSKDATIERWGRAKDPIGCM